MRPRNHDPRSIRPRKNHPKEFQNVHGQSVRGTIHPWNHSSVEPFIRGTIIQKNHHPEEPSSRRTIIQKNHRPEEPIHKQTSLSRSDPLQEEGQRSATSSQKKICTSFHSTPKKSHHNEQESQKKDYRGGMKIYTKKGDAGKTGLIGGTRVPKDHVRIESYGTVDELNSQLGVLIAHVEDAKRIDFLHGIQSTLFTLGSHLAADPEKNRMTLPEMSAADVEELEKAIDALDEQLPELKNFVLPSGNVASAQAHVARCVCRRAERRVFTLSELAPIPEQALPYLNRLSDYFFNLARQLTVAGGDKEILWTPKTN